MECALVVLAKEPRPGRAKTRCCPPCTPGQAAALAEAALADTLAVVASTEVARRVLVLDGQPGPWAPPSFEVIGQREGRLDERLAAAFEDVGGPALLIGMDTPQVTTELLESSVTALVDGAADAVIGPALDGGYWSIGLCQPHPSDIVGVAMSRPDTYRRQLAQLRRRHLGVRQLPELRDVDTFEHTLIVAAAMPGTRFAATTAGIAATLRQDDLLLDGPGRLSGPGQLVGAPTTRPARFATRGRRG